MASSSTSSIHKSFKYDVFLSFRGTDTRNTFVDHLYCALKHKDIHTYEEIKKGENINDELIKSIHDSKFYIIVFSKDYASSSWCLEELVKIIECQKTDEHTAYPVFYDVEPTQVRYQTGAVGEAFSKHEKKEDAEKWREALKEAADLAGWELKENFNGHQDKLIQEVVEDILGKLHISFSFDKKLVGIETRVYDLVSSLKIGIDKEVRMIGIKGMGGIGKTTLARAVFDKISFQFEGKSFVRDVREASITSGLDSLRKKILLGVLNDKSINKSGVDWESMMKTRIRGRRVLIVLDDVDHINQLVALAGERDWFGPGSRIIITTRDEKVLQAHGVEWHDVSLLSGREAICLFSKWAFKKEIPNEGYQELSERFVRYANGLPLTIRVLGSSLCGEKKLQWENILKRLKTTPETETLNILELSYNGLDKDHKEIFLDVACMMKGWRKEVATQALESCGFYAPAGLRVLEQRSLITYFNDYYNHECVGMHDRIEEMGKDIVRRSLPNMPEKHSRLWKEDEILDIFANDLGTEETRCIILDTYKQLNLESVMKGLRKMTKLRFFRIKYERFREINEVSLYFPNALGYLYWYAYPFRSLPQTFQANNLVSLVMTSSKIIQLWEGGEKKVLSKLRFLDLDYSTRLSTVDVGLTPNLEIVNLNDCHKLVELSDSICMSMHLKILKLENCYLLEKLPEDLGGLEGLKKLNVSNTNIKHIPDSICMLKHLEELEFIGCSLLEKLPHNFGQLQCVRDLKYLDLSEFSLIEKLPEDLGQLASLEVLNLSSTKIKHLPDSICMLIKLKYLELIDCTLLEKLPEDIGQLECLRKLIIMDCVLLRDIPNSICNMKFLSHFCLRNCNRVEKLPEELERFECLKELDIEGTNISELPWRIFLSKDLRIYGSFEMLQSFGLTSQIQTYEEEE